MSKCKRNLHTLNNLALSSLQRHHGLASERYKWHEWQRCHRTDRTKQCFERCCFDSSKNFKSFRSFESTTAVARSLNYLQNCMLQKRMRRIWLWNVKTLGASWPSKRERLLNLQRKGVKQRLRCMLLEADWDDLPTVPIQDFLFLNEIGSCVFSLHALCTSAHDREQFQSGICAWNMGEYPRECWVWWVNPPKILPARR